MRKLNWICFFLIITNFCSKDSAQEQVYPFVFKPGSIDITLPSSIDARVKQNIPVTIVTPEIVRGNILVLPGWKFHRKRWLKETRLIQVSRKHGFRLICPEMNTSIYASRYFPQTRLKWSATPGLQWIKEILIPSLQKRKILLSSQDNYLLGLSTGARGVAQIGLALPHLWKAAASFSGDYDQTRMIQDKLMISVYGPNDKYKSRWQHIDNPYSKAAQWKIPLYLSHGRRDTVVPFSQSKRFYEALKSSPVHSNIVFKEVSAAHNFKFWDSQVEPAVEFFSKYRD